MSLYSPSTPSSSLSASSTSSCASSSPICSSTDQQRQQQPNEVPSTSCSGTSTSSSAVLSTYPLIPREQLELQEQLGVGTYGAVFKGLWERPDGHVFPVALKKVFMLEKEVEILSQIRHRNIIQFYGVSKANPDFFIVTEYAPNGSLYEHLHNTSEQISMERTIKWAIQIAKGVAYLHYEAPITVIHRDLKSMNVVVNKKFQCKLCDFGTSKDLTHSWTVPSWGGTAAWMSPEIISQREGITTATDVWSFAVVLWEMFSREVPYKGLTEFKIYSIISQHGVRLVIPDNCPEPLAELLKSCWRQNPKERPDMRCVLSILERMSQDKFLREECAAFLIQSKQEWRERIEEQLRELDALKLDLARQIEDLRRREQALRKRENSHRNFLHMVDILNVENVCEWNEDCVCEWVQNIAAAAVADFPEETVDTIISCVLQYGINGPRLLKITEKDLECLGIEPVALRRYITLKLDELRALNVQLCNYQCCPAGAIESSQPCYSCGPSPKSLSPNSTEPPIEALIMLHVGLYSRMVLPGPAYRFKVFLDSDWEQQTTVAADGTPVDNMMAPPLPDQLQDSATVIKEVNISMTGADGTNLLSPVQCICPPFGYLEWAQLGREEQRRKLPLTLILRITYTDQVIQPRNTRIQIQLNDLSGGPKTLCNKRVPLKLCATPTDTSLSRISTSLQWNPLRSPPAVAIVRRRRSFGSLSPERRPSLVSGSSSNLLNRSPVWADLAASIRNRNTACCTFRPVSRSIGGEHRAAAAAAARNAAILLHRSTSSAEDTASSGGGAGGRKYSETNNNKLAMAATTTMASHAAADPLHLAWQRAMLLNVRKHSEGGGGGGGGKKCFSETELSHHNITNRLQKFYLTTPNPAGSRQSMSSSSQTDEIETTNNNNNEQQQKRREKEEEEIEAEKPAAAEQKTEEKFVDESTKKSAKRTEKEKEENKEEKEGKQQPKRILKQPAEKWSSLRRRCGAGPPGGLSLVVPARNNPMMP